MSVSRAKRDKKKTMQDDKYLFVHSRSNIIQAESWQDALQDAFIHNDPVTDAISHISDLSYLKCPSPFSLEEQFLFLNNVPNDHYYNYPSKTGKRLITRKKSLRQHLLFSPNASNESKNDDAPSSFRQRILFFLFVIQKPSTTYAAIIIARALNKNLPTLQHIKLPKGCKRQKRQKRTESPHPFYTEAENAFSFRDQFNNFTETLFCENGKVIVRCFSSKGGFLIMNSYNRHHGRIEHDAYVNIRYSKLGSGLRIKCTCFDFRKTGGEGTEDIDPSRQKITRKNRCMHVRFLHKYLESDINAIPNIQTNANCKPLQQELSRSCKLHANKKTVLVSKNDKTVTFSVIDHHKTTPAFVLVNSDTHEARCHANCRYKFLRKPRKDATQSSYFLLSAASNDKTCVHIKALAENQKLLHETLKKPEVKKKKLRRKEYFSARLGKWVSISLGRHRPKEKDDEDLIR